VVFLDPDTGIAPEQSVGLKHVTGDEIHRVFSMLPSGDVLVFYQHARHKLGWLDETRKQFCEAIGQTDGVQTYTCKSLASDVAFFVVEK
jgi:hypothetical protein